LSTSGICTKLGSLARLGLSFILLIAPFGVATAAEYCDGSSQPGSQPNFCPYIHRVAVFGDVDKRKTEAEFAAQTGEPLSVIHERFAATGVLNCRGSKQTVEGSAQLTGNSKTITTAAHILEDIKTCEETSAIPDCTFSVQTPTGPVTKKIAKVIGQGFRCPTIPTSDLDWAVMELGEAITGVRPYKPDKAATDKLEIGDDVLLVCRTLHFWCVAI
jgi:hypothetical protein